MTQLELFSDQPAPAPAPRRGEYEIPYGAQVGRCRSCNARIVWIATAADRRLPLSVATIERREVNGQRHRFALSHFADCPQSREWKRHASH